MTYAKFFHLSHHRFFRESYEITEQVIDETYKEAGEQWKEADFEINRRCMDWFVWGLEVVLTKEN